MRSSFPTVVSLLASVATFTLADTANACGPCGWGDGSNVHAGSIGGDVGGNQVAQRVEAFNANLQPGQLAVSDRALSGTSAIGPNGTQNVWLDFSGSVGFSTSMRNSVLAGVEDVYAGFDVEFSLTQPAFPFTRIIYDNSGFGGVANEIDFRNLNRNTFAFVGTNFSASTNQKINYGINVGAHELGHTLGLRHHDSFGSIGQGVPGGTGAGSDFGPSFPGPASGNEFYFNIMSTPAIGGSTSSNNFLNGRAALSERSLIKLAFATDGNVVSETSSNNNSLGSAQVLDLQQLDVPNNRPAGTAQAGEVLPVRAASVDNASISNTSDSDFYEITAFADDFLSVEVMSSALDRIGDTVDTIARVYDASGNLLNYYGQDAVNDDELETLDSHIFDLIIPADGTYFIEVDAFGSSTGDYELFVQSFGSFDEIVLPGDANGDGIVNLADFGILRANFGSTMAEFAQGDFNGDGIVNLADFGILRANFGSTSSDDIALLDAFYATVVPEPTTLAIAATGLLALRRRRI